MGINEDFPIQQDSSEGEQSFVEQESEASTLLYQVLVGTTEGMTQEEAETYLSALLESGEIGIEHLLFERIVTEHSKQLPMPSYHPDWAVREASLVQKSQWKPNESGVLSHIASNDLEVYLSTLGRSLEVSEAMRKIRKLSESTILSALILLGLWSVRRTNKQVSKDGIRMQYNITFKGKCTSGLAKECVSTRPLCKGGVYDVR